MALTTPTALNFSRRMLSDLQAGQFRQINARNAISFFSTHSSRRGAESNANGPMISNEVPPESPRYVYVPEPPQIQHIVRRGRKGTLPRPRAIPFHRGSKTSNKYLSKVTPEPLQKSLPEGLTSDQKEYIAYKDRQSALRRQNLREGLKDLFDRKKRHDYKSEKIRESKKAIFELKVNAPEREDESLTKASILPSMLPGALRIQPDPNWESKLAEKRERYRLKQEEKMAERRNVLHTLYMNAKDFIISEEELAKKVESEFEKQFYKDHPDRSIWDEEGIPETTQWMLAQAEGRGRSAADASQAYTDISKERVQRIAEDLTGGKM